MKINLKSAATQIRQADIKQVECQLNIAKLLTIIRDHELYLDAGYTNFALCVRGEFEFAPSTACTYCAFYAHYTRLGYKPEEMHRLMQQFSWRRVLMVIKDETKIAKHRRIKSVLAEIDNNAPEQFNILLQDTKDRARFEQLLSRFGMEESRSGRRTEMSSSFVKFLDYHEALEKGKKKGKLSAVA